MKPNTIWFCIVAYHPHKRNFKRLLTALSDWPVIVVDNAETPGTLQGVTIRKNVSTIVLGKNCGYGGGANVGMRNALNNRAEWAVILNQDITLTQKSIKELTDQIGEREPSILGSLTGVLDVARWTTIFPSHNAEYISGSCMAIHKAVIEQVGYFYEPYFMYYEDVDFCIRAKRAGFLIVKIPVGELTHTESASLGRGSFLHEYYLARNHLLFVERLAPPGVQIYEWLRVPKTLLEYQRQNNTGGSAGIKDYLLRRFGRMTGPGPVKCI